MPIESPSLDDLRYDRVVEELLRRIPVHAPEWTDYNDNDPGITLIQLFAYLSEQIGWRLNRVPEKTHIELLKLLGTRLLPARAARTRIAMFLASPITFHGVLLDASSRVSKKSKPPVFYETDVAYDVVPAEPRVIVTTKHPYLWDLLRLDEVGNHEPAPTDSELPSTSPAAVTRWMTVAWDGQDPKPADMPVDPIDLAPPASTGETLPYLWIGLAHNDSRDAGFLGAAVTLTIQFDDDEQPSATKSVRCEPVLPVAEPAPPPITWLAYYDEDAETMVPIRGRIVDGTDKLARSGAIQFTVPASLGPIPDAMWTELRAKFPPDGLPVADPCAVMTTELVDGLPTSTTWNPGAFATALTNAVSAATAEAALVKPAVIHPLDPALHDASKITAWLRIGPLDNLGGKKLRHVGFNVVPVTQTETTRNLLVGRSNGRPGQVMQLGHRNVLAGSLTLAVAESSDPTAVLTTWTETDSLPAAGPFDRVYDLDPEAGVVTFGDGKHGRIPPLVPKGGNVVAMSYRHGGGVAGEAAVGDITGSQLQITGLTGVVNIVSATGGEDAETVEQAKLRARKELATRSRAVTSADFAWISLRTPDVRVARAIVVPRRRPLPASSTATQLAAKRAALARATAEAQPLCVPCSSPVTAHPGAPPSVSLVTPSSLAPATCGPPLPTGDAGLDDDFEAPGVVTVVVVPDVVREPGAPPALFEPLPTPSFMRTVCRWLDCHRLVTTEIRIAPPQYCRLCDFAISVRARPGWSRLALADAVTAMFASWLDVLAGGDPPVDSANGCVESGALRVGPDGAPILGAPFGGQVHVADLIARVLRVPGVDRVESLTCRFVRTKSNASPRTGQLVMCPSGPGEYTHVDLAAEETTSFDPSSLLLSTVV